MVKTKKFLQIRIPHFEKPLGKKISLFGFFVEISNFLQGVQKFDFSLKIFDNQEMFAPLSILVQRHHSALMGSMESERLFATASQTITPIRNSMFEKI